MKLTNALPLVHDARNRGYAVPAFNTNGGTYDITRAALEAAQELSSPLIIQEYEPNAAYRGFRLLARQVRFLMDELKITVPVALHLDHGHSLASVLQALQAGFTSVMIDASHEPLAINVERTQKVLESARALNASVEAEIGYVKGNEPVADKQIGRIPVPETPTVPPAKTTVAQAVEFIHQVDVDMLAVAIGTTHGVYQKQTAIDFDLLGELHSALPVPLVMHGTSGISLEDLNRLSRSGMSKVNFGEPFRYNYIRYFLELTDTMEHRWHPWRIMQALKDRLKDDMKQIITALGSEGKV